MSPPTRTAAEIVTQYRWRHAGHLTLFGLWLIYTVMVLWRVRADMLALFISGGLAAVAIVDVAVWRCPNCRAWLGRTLGRTQCTRCGARFSEAGGAAA
jgi:hypothetical protein